MIVATAGHVDHGKTSLVRQLTGIDTDRLEAEKARGLTIDLGFAYTTIAEQRVGFIDVPGHIRFINNMLAGVSVIDAGMLVIAADDGPMPQTREHLAVLDLLGIDRGIIVISKIDRVSPERVDQVRAEIDDLLANTTLGGADILEVSSETGAGISEVRQLLQALAADVRQRQQDEHFRLAVDRAFSLKGAGLVVTGSVFSGRINVGDEVNLQPQQVPLRVRSLHRQNEASESGFAGDRVSLNLAGDVQADDVSRGNWVTTCTAPASQRADARIRVLPGDRPIRHWMPVHVHTAANHVTARIATLESNAIAPGESGLVQLVLSQPINLWRGDKVIVRDQGAEWTLGGGSVLDPFAPGKGRTQPDRIEKLAALSATDTTSRIDALLSTCATGFDWQTFASAETTPENQLLAALQHAGGIRLGNIAIAAARAETLGTELFKQTESWLKQNAAADGMTRDELRRQHSLPPNLLTALLDRLVAAKLLKHEGGRYQLPGQQRALEPAVEKLWAKVEPILARHPLKPPVVHDLAREVGLPPAAIDKLLGPCVKAGLLVRPAENRYFLPGAMDELFALAQATAKANGGELTVKDYRDATGVGRNLSIEILEYFDRTGKTIRVGDKRKLQQR